VTLEARALDLVPRVAAGRATEQEVELVAEAVVEELLTQGREAELIAIQRRIAAS
jgi:hypothetical protein